ncbi:MAG TPA: VWA domain-containing protein [Thermoanaerobaculia bacterium]|nr:VWA domain-containing protein [Thermoanaerobaculia bacterium]
MKNILVAAAAVFLIFPSINVHAAANNPAPAEAAQIAKPDPTADPGVRKLSRRERRDAIAKLSEKYQTFLKDVEPILLQTELNTFLLLESDAQRDLYIEEFWRRRDPDPKSAYNDYREQYGEMLEEARQQFKYMTSDRTKIYLIHGRPGDRLPTECDRYLQPLEIWRYHHIPGIGHDVRLLFYRPRNGGDYRLWTPIGMGSSNESLQDLLSTEIIASYLGDLQRAVNAVFFESLDAMSRVSKIGFDCKDGREILTAVFQSQQNSTQLQSIYSPPKVNEEDINKILRTAVLSNPAAPRLVTGEVSTRYPGKRGARTSVQMTIPITRDHLRLNDIDGVGYYNVDVSGEVLKDGKMFETYRYKYDIPAEQAGETIPIVIERFLRPAGYVSRIKIIDANSGAEAIVEATLDVPAVQEDPALAARKADGAETIARIQSNFIEGESRLRLVPLPNDLLTGLHHIDTIVTGEEIKSVEFYLDGKKIMVKRSPPFALNLDLGEVPQARRVRAVGLDANQKIVSGDELVVNVGADPFRVRIVSPRIAANVQGNVRVEIDASIPEGKTLENIELYLNETRLATLYSPPFVQTIRVPADLGIAYLRAVATLEDETLQPAEDVVFLNSPEFLQQVEVHLVELPTTVISRGRPVLGLTESAFTVKDEGTTVKLAKFEYVQNLPLSLGIAIDSSGSMRDRMPEAQKTGAQFLKSVLKPGDQAFLVSFDTQPVVLQKWSRQLSALHAGLASLRAEEATALYDAIVFSLYNFQSIKGQRALIVITDGKDTASRFSFDQALEYAKRTSVPIYGIGIGIRANEIDARYKFGRFASETGGNVYYIDNVVDLSRIYNEIQQELRSQYLLGFYPPDGVQAGSKWRQVSVEVTDGKAKTVRGYYP